MCGIAGVCRFNEIRQHDIELVKSFNSTMRRRGPDAEGLWTDNANVVLGFRRLAIQDVNVRSNQPMVTTDGGHVLVFNGEIYNAASIRAELSSLVKFRTTSDTEVLLYALAYYGIEKVLARIDGIFAFAYYNISKKELILARDRPGTKPLYYGIASKRLVFSSQYDHLLSDPVVGRSSIDHNAIGHYIDLGYVPEGEGFLIGTFLLPHGHYAKWTACGLKLIPYFQYPIASNRGVSPDLESVIQQGVEDQLISDVPLGTFMSGGIDSTLVTYYARQKVADLDTFNIGAEDVHFDESKIAHEFSSLFQTKHHARLFREDDLKSLINENIQAYSEPFSDYSSLPTLLLSRFAKERVTVTLSGDGGDELFWGYHRSGKSVRYAAERLKGKQNLIYQIICDRLRGKKTLPLSLLRYKSWSEMFYGHMTVTGSKTWKQRILSDADTMKPYFFDEARQLEDGVNDVGDLMNLMRKMEFDLHLQRILIKVDRASMYHSLEVRVPLLSNSILTASTDFGFETCFENGMGKRPLRKILSKHAGQSLTTLPKRGFVVPIDDWIRGSLKTHFHETILDMPGSLSSYFKRHQIELMLKEHCKEKVDWSWMIWSLYSLSSWHAKHMRN